MRWVERFRIDRKLFFGLLFSCKNDDVDLNSCSSDSSFPLLKETITNGILSNDFQYNEDSSLKTWNNYNWNLNGELFFSSELVYDNENVSEILITTYSQQDTFCINKSLSYNSSGLLNKSIGWAGEDCILIDTLQTVYSYYDSNLYLDSSIVYHNGYDSNSTFTV